MRQFKKFSALILSAVLLLAALPMALSASAEVDAAALDVQLDFTANQYAVNATRNRSGIERAADTGLFATKQYNFIEIRAKVGSAVVATFTIPEGAEAPVFQTADTANGSYTEVEAVADNGTCTIGALDKPYLRISLPVCSKDYALKTLAFDTATDETVDFTEMSSASTGIDMSTVDGVYDHTAGSYYYHVGQKRLLIMADCDVVFKTAPGSAFALRSYRYVAKNLAFSVSADGIYWTSINANAYESENSSYSVYNYYFSSIGEGNQFVKVTVTGANGWDAYTALYSASFESSSAVTPVAEERVTTEKTMLPEELSTIDFQDTTIFSSANYSKAFDVAGVYAYAGNFLYDDTNKCLYTFYDGSQLIFRTQKNSTFKASAWKCGTATITFAVSPDGETWTDVTATMVSNTIVSGTGNWDWQIDAIGAENQYVRMTFNTKSDWSNYGRLYNVSYVTPTSVIDFSQRISATDILYTGNIDVLKPYGLVSYTDTAAYEIVYGKNRLLIYRGPAELVWKTVPGSPFIVGTSQNGGSISYSVSPDGEQWTEVTPTQLGTTYAIPNIGADNQYVKMNIVGPAGDFTSDVRITKITFIKDEPTINVLDVALHTDAEATDVTATVTYDAAKLTYKGYYDAVGTATVTDNGDGTLTVSVTAEAATKGDWLKLVFLPADGVLGSVDVTVTTDAGTVTAPVWFDTAEEGKVLVEFDTGDSAETFVADASTALTPTAPTREGYAFAGWYTTTGVVVTADDLAAGYAKSTRLVAKWVDNSVLTIKAQLKTGTTTESDSTNLRVLATLDSLSYTEAGFVIQINGGTEHTRTVTTVYNQIKASGVSYNAWEAGFSEDSRFFFTFNIRNIPQASFADEIKVTPFWETPDGTTVYGAARTMSVNGSADTKLL